MARSAIPVLPSGDLGVSEAFYAGLGFEVAARYDGYLVTHDGAVELHLKSPDLADEQTESAAAAECFVHVQDAIAYWKQLSERGLAGVGAPSARDYGLVEFTVVDPFGNHLRFGSPRDAG